METGKKEKSWEKEKENLLKLKWQGKKDNLGKTMMKKMIQTENEKRKQQ